VSGAFARDEIGVGQALQDGGGKFLLELAEALHAPACSLLVARIVISLMQPVGVERGALNQIRQPLEQAHGRAAFGQSDSCRPSEHDAANDRDCKA